MVVLVAVRMGVVLKGGLVAVVVAWLLVLQSSAAASHSPVHCRDAATDPPGNFA